LESYSNGVTTYAKATICKITEQSKKMGHPELKDSRQIRASVIINWLKQTISGRFKTWQGIKA
jgi:hypothetical protein